METLQLAEYAKGKQTNQSHPTIILYQAVPNARKFLRKKRQSTRIETQIDIPTVILVASLAVTLMTVGKVFLIDTSHLQNLLGLLSLVGLGLSLTVLGFLYQRFVFNK